MMAPLYERRVGPRKFSPSASVAPASRWDAYCRDNRPSPSGDPLHSPHRAAPFASSKRPGHCLLLRSHCYPGGSETRQLTSKTPHELVSGATAALRFALRCVITLTSGVACRRPNKPTAKSPQDGTAAPCMAYRGAGSARHRRYSTTYGAEPYRNRVPTQDAVVVKRLHDAGAVLVAKLSLWCALCVNDIWFGGQTVNPWLLE